MNGSVVCTIRKGFGFGALLLLTGCSSIFGDRSRGPADRLDTTALEQAGYSFDERGAQRALPPSDGKPTVVLEVRNGKRHLERIPLPPDKPTFLQDIVDDAKLVSKIGRIEVTILRPTGSNSPPIRMDSDFDPETKRLVIGQNYAVQPNDTIIVSKDTRSWLDNFSILPKKSAR
jgi:hypothetical protein